jgi:hypothetical protein
MDSRALREHPISGVGAINKQDWTKTFANFNLKKH